MMAGTVLAVGMLGASAALAMGLASVGVAAVTAQRAAAGADAAALAAADTASGVFGGVPCERAAAVARAGGAALVSCDADGLVATVVVTSSSGALIARAAARAGPAT
jgi:secretion/DNA translocation related TadE-like protein